MGFSPFSFQTNFSLIEIADKMYQLYTLKKILFDFKCTKTKQVFFSCLKKIYIGGGEGRELI
jgi:hypothetical protein